MIVIVPCCGESQRYDGTKKQFLKSPSGLPLPVFSASGLKGVDKIIYTFIINDFVAHNDNQTAIWGGGLCMLSQQTSSQVETIVQTICVSGLQDSPIYIKDCDNYFEADVQPNCITVKHTRNAQFKLHNKSYTQSTKSGIVLKTAERAEISNYINVGGYGFMSGQLFIDHAEGKDFISQVIASAIKKHSIFRVNHCDNYIDYGEQDDFDNFIKNYQK